MLLFFGFLHMYCIFYLRTVYRAYVMLVVL